MIGNDAIRMRPLTVHLWDVVASCRQGRLAVLFPYAGGRAYSMPEWVRELLGDWCVAVVQYPSGGAGCDALARPAESVESGARAVAADIAATADRPVILVGHSMGAVVGYETGLALCEYGVTPRLLVASAAVPPHKPWSVEYSDAVPDADLVDRLVKLGGLPAEALAQPELLRLMLPVLRRDFRIVHDYIGPDRRWPLGCPVLAVGGDADPCVPADALPGWADLTTAATEVQVRPGDHFYFRSDLQGLRERIAALAFAYPHEGQEILPPSQAGTANS